MHACIQYGFFFKNGKKSQRILVRFSMWVWGLCSLKYDDYSLCQLRDTQVQSDHLSFKQWRRKEAILWSYSSSGYCYSIRSSSAVFWRVSGKNVSTLCIRTYAYTQHTHAHHRHIYIRTSESMSVCVSVCVWLCMSVCIVIASLSVYDVHIYRGTVWHTSTQSSYSGISLLVTFYKDV